MLQALHQHKHILQVKAKFRDMEVSDSRYFPFGGQKWFVAAWISAVSVTDLLLPAWTGTALGA